MSIREFAVKTYTVDDNKIKARIIYDTGYILKDKVADRGFKLLLYKCDENGIENEKDNEVKISDFIVPCKIFCDKYVNILKNTIENDDIMNEKIRKYLLSCN